MYVHVPLRRPGRSQLGFAQLRIEVLTSHHLHKVSTQRHCNISLQFQFAEVRKCYQKPNRIMQHPEIVLLPGSPSSTECQRTAKLLVNAMEMLGSPRTLQKWLLDRSALTTSSRSLHATVIGMHPRGRHHVTPRVQARNRFRHRPSAQTPLV